MGKTPFRVEPPPADVIPALIICQWPQLPMAGWTP
jgi:hypothetical protein